MIKNMEKQNQVIKMTSEDLRNRHRQEEIENWLLGWKDKLELGKGIEEVPIPIIIDINFNNKKYE